MNLLSGDLLPASTSWLPVLAGFSHRKQLGVMLCRIHLITKEREILSISPNKFFNEQYPQNRLNKILVKQGNPSPQAKSFSGC